MKQKFTFFLLIIIVLVSKSQTPQYTWVRGPDTINQLGSFGTINIPHPNNEPRGRTESCSWYLNNSLYLFGGYFYNFDYGNDLWKYDIASNRWTWIGGSNQINQYGQYGPIGVATSTAYPGSRRGSAYWIENNNLWLFGGYGYNETSVGYLNDLWKYNTLTKQWTWVSGTKYVNYNASYGTQNVPGIGNIPGGRMAATSVKDNSGNLWLFSGGGFNESSPNLFSFNDLWKYNISTNEWTWVSGSKLGNQQGVYGTRGVPSSSNIPHSRLHSTGAVDNNGDFWFFSGWGYGAYGSFNDLWKYKIATNEWTWVSGSSSLLPVYGSCGPKGVPSNTVYPGSRSDASLWVNNSDVWVFSGGGFYCPSGPSLNDLWKYDVLTDEWNLVGYGGLTSDVGIYGTMGVASPNNFPGARDTPNLWKDGASNIWIFGGSGVGADLGSGLLNDLWKIDGTSLIGINENKKEEGNLLELFPNPCYDKAYIASKTEIDFWLINALGQEIGKYHLEKSQKTEINLPYSGIYFIKTNNKTNSNIIKIISLKN